MHNLIYFRIVGVSGLGVMEIRQPPIVMDGRARCSMRTTRWYDICEKAFYQKVFVRLASARTICQNAQYAKKTISQNKNHYFA